MNFVKFLAHCHHAWQFKECIGKKITEQPEITAHDIARSLDLSNLTVSLAIAYLSTSGEVFAVGAEDIGTFGNIVLSPKYVSRDYLLDEEAKKERARIEKERVKERIRQELTEDGITIPALARKLREDEQTVQAAIADLEDGGETILGQLVKDSRIENISYPTYAKGKPVQAAIN